MKSYLVMFHIQPGFRAELSPNQMQEVAARYTAWFDRLREAGRVGVSAKLREEGGRHLRRQQQTAIVSDGPYAEAKDVVNGLFILHADDYDAAQATLADCPHFDFGWVELREIEFVR